MKRFKIWNSWNNCVSNDINSEKSYQQLKQQAITFNIFAGYVLLRKHNMRYKREMSFKKYFDEIATK